MLKLYEKTKIYALCEARYVTGGTEAVHQLIAKLRKFGHDAKIVYLPDMDNPTADTYKIYDIECTDFIEDSKENILIAPESWITKLNPYKSIQKAIWWLSVDNVQKNTTSMGQNINKRFSNLKKFPFIMEVYKILNRYGNISFNFKLKENQKIVHLAQSRYAEHFLINKGAKNLYPLTDYLNKVHFSKKRGLKKENIILYNPKKGGEITKKLIKAAPSLKWIPIKNMTSEKVRELMEKSKVYIDFGEHPGKDRIPREAAINNCCVIVGLRGSTRFPQDVPICEAYKFNVKYLDVSKIIEKIKDCLKNYDERMQDFETYRRVIRMNEEQFELEIKKIFGIKKT